MARSSFDRNLDTIYKRVARIEIQIRWMVSMSNELLLAKKLLQNKDNRKLLKRLKKVKDARKAFPKLMANITKKVIR